MMTGASTAVRQDGFILVTSLVMLVVITLLAVSAMNSSTLGLRMVSNQQDKNQALQAANAALSEVERLMADPGFADCAALFTVSSRQGPCNSAVGRLARAVNYSDFQADGTDGWQAVYAVNYPDGGFWQGPGVQTYDLPDQPGDARMRVVYRVDYLAFASQTAARDGRAEATFYFLISARADGATPAARAITQSVFELNR